MAEAIERALEGHETTLRYDYPSQDGVRKLESTLVPERSARGEVVSALSITLDVTLPVRAEEGAARSALLAERLIGMVSHDLRTPIQAIVLRARRPLSRRAPAPSIQSDHRSFPASNPVNALPAS